MTWLELSKFVRKEVSTFTYGPKHSSLLIVENPDGEGGRYDVYSSDDSAILKAFLTISEARKQLDNTDRYIKCGGSFMVHRATLHLD
jgi:hypothetical protein